MRFSWSLNSPHRVSLEGAEKKVYSAPQVPASSAYVNYLFTNSEEITAWYAQEFQFIYYSEYRPSMQTIEDLDAVDPIDDFITLGHHDGNECEATEIHEFQPQSMRDFFISQRVDTPVVLQQGRSKFRPNALLAHYRLVGMLSSHGSHRRTTIALKSILTEVVRSFFCLEPERLSGISQLAPVLFFSNQSSQEYVSPDADDEDEDECVAFREDPFTPFTWRYGFYNAAGGLTLSPGFLTYVRLFEGLARYRPIFAMKTQKVDKMRFKHSRGKTGKYMVEWKYIPRYRRTDVVLRWLVDDIKFQRSNTFKSRIDKSIRLFLLSPRDHTVVRNRAYVHHTAYARYKNTLLRSLRRVR